MHPKDKYASVKVIRTGDCDNKVSVHYSTEELKDHTNIAFEDDDFEPIKKAELTFDKGEIEKVIEIKLNVEEDEDDEEQENIYLVFGVRLFDP